MRRWLRAGAALTAISAITMPAQADTFTYSGYTVDPANVSISISSPVSRNVLAGEITLDGTGPNANQTLAAWCLDLINTLIGAPATYTYQESTLTTGVSFGGMPSLNATQIREIGDLMGTGGVNGDLAATQIAIWAIEYGANFVAVIPAALQADETADETGVLAGGGLDHQAFDVTVLHDAASAPNQTLGFAVPVPGPVVGAGWPGLAMAGLGLGWLSARRRKPGGVGRA